MSRLRRTAAILLSAGLVSGCVIAGSEAAEQREPVWESEELDDHGALTSVLSEGVVTAIGGKLYTHDDDELYVLDDTSSPKSWRFEELTTGHSSHLIGDETIVGFAERIGGGGRFAVFEPDGEQRFQYPAEDVSELELEVGAVTATGDVAVAAIAETKTGDDGRSDTTTALIGIGLGDGERLWRRNLDFEPAMVSMAAPAPAGDVAQLGVGSSDSGLALQALGDAPVVYLSTGEDAVAVDVRTGEERWRLTGPVEKFPAATVAMSGDHIVSIDPGDAVEDIAEVEVADIDDGSTEVFTSRIEYASGPNPAVRLCDGRLLGRTTGGRPELVDLERRETVWTAEKKGKPLGCKGSTIVYATSGEFANLIGEVVTGDGETWDFGSKDVERGFSPVHLDEDLVIGRGFENTVALDRATGTALWEAEGSARSVCATADHYFIGDGVGLRAFER